MKFPGSELVETAARLSSINEVRVFETGVKYSLEWNWMLERSKGFCLSITDDVKHCKEAQELCHRVSIVHDNQIAFLTKIQKTDMFKKLNLLVLEEGKSCLLEIGALAASWDFIPHGCLVACTGKGLFVDKFFQIMKIPPVQTEPIRVWIKP